MDAKMQKLTTLTFKGANYEDHGLEIDMLTELISYKKLLINTAKEIWRDENPGRTRLPKLFEESIRIKFFSLGEGSTKVPLMRELVYPDGELPYPIEGDELDRAVEIIEQSIEAADKNHVLPEKLPSKVIPLFLEFGRSLGPDDSILLKSHRRKSQACYSVKAREYFYDRVDGKYHDVVELTGEVRAADLDGCNFTIRLDNGLKVSGKFEAKQEEAITNALREHSSLRLRISGDAEFLQDGSLYRIIRIEEVETLAIDHVDFDPSQRPIWEIISEIGEQIPDEALAELPEDLSMNFDKYLYGRKGDNE